MTQLELNKPEAASEPFVLNPKAILVAMTELGGLQVVLALTGLVRNKVAAIYLKTSGMGEWSQIQGVATTVFILVQFGMIVGLSRNTAAAKTKSDRQRQLSVANTLTMALALVAIIGAVAFFLASGSNGRFIGSLGIPARWELLLLLFVVVLAPVEGLRNNFLSFLQGMLDIRGIATKRAIAVILATIAAIPLVSMFGITGACLQFSVASVLLAVLLGHRCYQLGYRPMQFQWERTAAIGLATIGGATLLVTFVYSWLDVLIRSQLIRYAGLSEAGIYQAAFLLSSQVTQIAIGSIGVFSLASISQSPDPERISRQLHVMYRVILPISAVGLGFLGLVERPAIQLLFSSQFKSSAEFLPLLLVGNSLQAASWVTGAPLLGCARVRAWLTLQMIGACLRYLAVLAFLPTLGPQAIPLAFLLGQMFDMIASLVLSSRILKIVTSRADLARIGLSSVLPGVVALLGLHPTPATFSAGVTILIAGGIVLAPAQASRLAVKATEITTRWRSHSKHQTIMKDGLNTMSEQLSDAQASKIPAEYRMGSSAVISSERGSAVRAPHNISPLVSVIIPAYNNVGYLEEAVDSVFGQTYSAVECIVIDDGSTDQTAEIIEKVSKKYPSLKTARKVNGGPSSARNMGLRLCSGEFVSFLDHDDVLLPDKIARQVEFLNTHPEVGLVHSDYLVVSQDLHPLAVFAAEMPRGMDPLDALCYRNWFNPLVALIRRSLIDRIGGFDAELDGAEDWDYWIRCAKATRISYLAGPVALYRQHGGQMSRNYYRMKSACLLVAKKNFNENGRQLRLAMAAIELTYARHLWIQRQRPASLAALLKSGLQHGFGLHTGNMLRQFQIMTQSQLKPL